MRLQVESYHPKTLESMVPHLESKVFSEVKLERFFFGGCSNSDPMMFLFLVNIFLALLQVEKDSGRRSFGNLSNKG